MRRGGPRGWRTIAGMLFALAIVGFPVSAARAAESVLLPDGDLLTVWQARQRVMLSGDSSPATDGTSIGYSVAGIDGSYTGTVSITTDLALDSWPRLVNDPFTGWPRLFWSRYDGSVIRIAYARYGPAGWSDIRYVTSGTANALVPRVGAGREGAYLFWISWEGGNYQYAPIDLRDGLLLSYPRSVPIYAFPKDAPVADSDMDATDAPVVTGDCLDSGCDTGTLLEGSDGATTDAMDVPVVTGAKASIWTVGGSAACRSQIMVFPNPDPATATVVRFTHGFLTAITVNPVPTPTPASYGDTLARALLASFCD